LARVARAFADSSVCSNASTRRLASNARRLAASKSRVDSSCTSRTRFAASAHARIAWTVVFSLSRACVVASFARAINVRVAVDDDVDVDSTTVVVDILNLFFQRPRMTDRAGLPERTHD
jgi:hypothetical protein